jgi:hypothetical protein
MACVRGRCPCWPQTEPFDTAEMELLSAVREYISPPTCWNREACWLRIQERCQAVQPRRRAYVLSTLVTQDSGMYYSYTTLRRAVDNKVELEWLVNQGVCLNTAGVFSSSALGWTGGSAHPGRPSWNVLYGPFLLTEAWSVKGLLLGAGAYPPRVSLLKDMSRHWHAWHARASRRLWAALSARRMCPGM